MKIGIIADVHANADNLRRALALLRNLGADEIVCAGDLVDGETEGEAAAQFFRGQNIPCVEGNHDRLLSDPALAGIATRFPPLKGTTPTAERLRADELSPETVAYLRDLPGSLRFKWDQHNILLTHATTWSLDRYVLPDESPAELRRIAQEAEANLVIIGHSHVPMAVEIGGVWIFNPGSVYGGRRAPHTATCALLELAPLRYRVFDIDTGKPTLYTFNRINPDQHTNDGHTHIELS